MRTLAIIFGLTVVLSGQAQTVVYSENLAQNYNAGIAAFEAQNFTNAQSFFEKCIAENALCFEAYLAIGKIHYANKNYNETLNFCEKAKEIRSFDPELSAIMGKTYYYQTNYLASETCLKRAISTGANSNENVLLLALALQKTQKYREALYYYERLISQEPGEVNYWMNRGLLFIEMETYDKAFTDYVQALKLSPENARIYIQLADISFMLKDIELAFDYIEAGMTFANQTEKVDLLLLKGNQYRLQGDYEKAEAFYAQAYELERTNPLVLTCQAAVEIDLENYESAIEKCNAAIEADPNLMQAYFNRGIANEMMRNVDDACNDWQKAFILGSQKAIEYLNGPVCNE